MTYEDLNILTYDLKSHVEGQDQQVTLTLKRP